MKLIDGIDAGWNADAEVEDPSIPGEMLYNPEDEEGPDMVFRPRLSKTGFDGKGWGCRSVVGRSAMEDLLEDIIDKECLSAEGIGGGTADIHGGIDWRWVGDVIEGRWEGTDWRCGSWL